MLKIGNKIAPTIVGAICNYGFIWRP